VRSDNRNVDTIGRALVISFDSENNRYVLTGDVRLDHDGSVFEGDEVSYDTEDNSVSITGQRAVLQPGRRGNQTADVPERDPCSPA
jgi:lipopolysaccharide export system protein LptA